MLPGERYEAINGFLIKGGVLCAYFALQGLLMVVGCEQFSGAIEADVMVTGEYEHVLRLLVADSTAVIGLIIHLNFNLK